MDIRSYFEHFRQYSLSKKLALAIAVTLAISFTLIFLLASTLIDSTAGNLGEEAIHDQASNLLRWCAEKRTELTVRLAGDWQQAKALLQSRHLVQASTETHQVIDQFSGAAKTATLPLWHFAGKPLGASPPKPLTALANSPAFSGSRYAIFQRLDRAGSMVCLATNIAGADGRPAIWRYLPAKHQQTAVILDKVMIGEAYQGKAFTLIGTHRGIYLPLVNEHEEICGMIFVGSAAGERQQDRYPQWRIQAELLAALCKQYSYSLAWNQVAQKQWDVAGQSLALPRLYWQGAKDLQALVDELAGGNNGICAFYQKLPGQRAMIRLVSSEKASDGSRIPPRQFADDNELTRKLWHSVLEGRVYYQAPGAMNQYRYILCAPLSDAQGVFAMLALEIDIRPWLEELSKLEVPAAGHMVLMSADGMAVIHPHYRGENLFKAADGAGKAYGKSLGELAQKLKYEELASYRYHETRDIQLESREKIAVIANFHPWGWVISVEAYVDRLGHSDGLGWLLLVVWGGLTALAIVSGVKIARALFLPLRHLTTALETIADRGDLPAPLPVISGDFARASAAFNRMVAQLEHHRRQSDDHQRELATSVEQLGAVATGLATQAGSLENPLREATTIIHQWQDLTKKLIGIVDNDEAKAGNSSASLQQQIQSLRHLLSGNQQIAGQLQQTRKAITALSELEKIADNAQIQANFVQDTSAGTEEISFSIRNVAQNAQQAMEQAREALSAAERGARSVENAVEGMQGIAESSEKMGEIIGVVSDIAEQTNLLALNATIEAARAGIHGKGFAVVAVEVRNLAERSADAANEISHLIRENTRQAESGNQTIMKAAEALKQILQAVRATSDMMTSISQAALQQETSARQVLQTMERLKELSAGTSLHFKDIFAQQEQLLSTIDHLQASTENNITGVKRQADTSEHLQQTLTELLADSKSLKRKGMLHKQHLDKAVQFLSATQREISNHAEKMQRLPQTVQDLAQKLGAGKK